MCVLCEVHAEPKQRVSVTQTLHSLRGMSLDRRHNLASNMINFKLRVITFKRYVVNLPPFDISMIIHCKSAAKKQKSYSMLKYSVFF